MNTRAFRRIAGAQAKVAFGSLASPRDSNTPLTVFLLYKAACTALYAGYTGSASRAYKAALDANENFSGSLLKTAGIIRSIKLSPTAPTLLEADGHDTPFTSTRTVRGAVPLARQMEIAAAKKGAGLYALHFRPGDIIGSFDELQRRTAALACSGQLAGLYFLPRRWGFFGSVSYAIFVYGKERMVTVPAADPSGNGNGHRKTILQHECPLDDFPVNKRSTQLMAPGASVVTPQGGFILVDSLQTGLKPVVNKRVWSKEVKVVLKSRVRFPIGIKLIAVVSSLLLGSLIAMTGLASFFFLRDATVRIEENNHTVSQITALNIDIEVQHLVSRARLLLDLSSGSAASEAARRFFSNNSDVLYVGVPGLASLPNDAALALFGADTARVEKAVSRIGNVEAATVFNPTLEMGAPALGVAIPYRDSGFKGTLFAFMTAERYLEALKPRGIVGAWVINAGGELLLHSDVSLMAARANLNSVPVVKAMRENAADNGLLRYVDANGIKYIASYKRIVFGDMGVIATAPLDKAFEAVEGIQRRNFLIMGAVLTLAVVLVYLYSRSITGPVSILMGAAMKVERGDYELDIRPQSRDELGALTETFYAMGRGLGEREKIKEAFGKFVNKTVANLAMTGDIRLGGERREATVFFSDIRSFTAMSETMDPEQVVGFLNAYFTRMVACVQKTGGAVDKFIGDSIMAIWGVPLSTGRDPLAAIEAAMTMRSELRDYNKTRGRPGRPIIRIGCGVNTGLVLAGQIGSTQRMEYTVIGDTVNLASRIEELNKPFSTDILITDYTLSKLHGLYFVEAMPMIRVKGKVNPLRIYAVIRRQDDKTGPRDLKDLRESLKIADVRFDASQVFEDFEEKKYEVLHSGGPGAPA